MKKEITISGYGGQGIMSMGKLLAKAGVYEGLEVVWIPTYGPEMRGGTANCSIILSDNPIGAPQVTNPTELIVMNYQSLLKFEDDLAAGGIIFVNSSIVKEKVRRKDVRACYVSCDTIAAELGNSKAANMVMLGAYVSATGALKNGTLQNMITNMFTGDKTELAELNIKALNYGADCSA